MFFGISSKSHPIKTTEVKVSFWVRSIFFISLGLFFATIFVTNLTSSSPTLFTPEQLSPHESFSDHAGSSAPASWDLLSERFIPEFLQPPTQPWDLFWPTILVIYICLMVRFLPSNNWTRLPVKILLLVLLGRYLIWRTMTTLNLSHWAVAAFSIFIYAIEIIGLINFSLYSLQSIWSTARKRSADADRYSRDVLAERYLPSVDVFVPTYNEPDFIVRRTVVGCQLMDYPNKKIYILDDGRRPHIRALAEELGCGYITRADNNHAKAGNLNNALTQTEGELIVIFDADFVPFKNFLTRTVGFFQQPKLALVQTPQSFYNPDHHARNLGVDHLVYDDLASFFMFSQSTRDTFNCAVCCGTSYIVRRKALENVGGYSTICLAEDSPTSIAMLTKGWEIAYLQEILSMGESTRNYVDFVKQRVRWHHSNYQIFCCGKHIPIWSSMNWIRMSFFLTFYLGSFQPLFRAILILTPLIAIYTGICPYLSTFEEIIYYFFPWFLLLVGTVAWMNEYTCSFFWNEVYETILCYPLTKCILSAIWNPFGLPFKVTRKGVKTNRKNYNLSYTWPLLVGIALIAIALCLNLVGYHLGFWQTAASSNFGWMCFWLIYNFAIMSIAVIAAIDQPERRSMDRFPLHTTCKLKSNLSECDLGVYHGYTINVSEGGALVILENNDFVANEGAIVCEFPEYDFSVAAEVCRQSVSRNRTRVELKFSQLSSTQYRRAIEMLYTDMNWWKQSKRPGNFDVFVAMFSSLLQLKPLRSKF